MCGQGSRFTLPAINNRIRGWGSCCKSPRCADTACHKLAQWRSARPTAGMREARGAEEEGGRMVSYVLGFHEIDQTQGAIVGGKGGHLGELSRIEGIRVPAGFCVTTDAFRRIIAEAP